MPVFLLLEEIYVKLHVHTFKALLITSLLVVAACQQKEKKLTDDERIDAAIAYARKNLEMHNLNVVFTSAENGGGRAIVEVKGPIENHGKKDLAYIVIKYYYKHIKGSAKTGELDLGGLAAGGKKVIKERIGSLTREGNYSSFVNIVEADFGEPEQ